MASFIEMNSAPPTIMPGDIISNTSGV